MNMKLRAIGCSGGIGSTLRTTSFLLDEDILLDAGTGVGDLTLDELRRIRHIFLTHSHLDHLAGLPLLVDTLFGTNDAALTIHGLPETLQVLQEHLFNWKLWPDFAELPSSDQPSMRYQVMQPGDKVELDGRCIEMVPAFHTVPATGYCVSTGSGAFVFSGDTSSNDAFWDVVNRIKKLKLLIVECAFANENADIAALSKHYCPKTLTEDLAKLQLAPKICITHLKPGYESVIMQQCREAMPQRKLLQLRGGDTFTI